MERRKLLQCSPSSPAGNKYNRRARQRLRLWRAAALMVASLTVFGIVNCGGDEETSNDQDLILAVRALDEAGFHDIWVSITQDGEIPATAETTARKMQALVAVTKWPDELADGADRLEVALGEMAAALSATNANADQAGPSAQAAHDLEHLFSATVWEYIYEEADIADGDGDSHHE